MDSENNVPIGRGLKLIAKCNNIVFRSKVGGSPYLFSLTVRFHGEFLSMLLDS